jgi:hypothetical protein
MGTDDLRSTPPPQQSLRWPRWRSFILGTAAGVGIWAGLLGPPLPMIGADLSKAIASAEVAPARWFPKVWLAYRGVWRGVRGRPGD